MDYPDVAYAASGERDHDGESVLDQGGEPPHWSDCYTFPESKADPVDFFAQDDIKTEAQSTSATGDHYDDEDYGDGDGDDDHDAGDDDDDKRGTHWSPPADNLSGERSDVPVWFQKRWNDHWVVPNVFLRGALFAGVRAKHRTLKNTLMASQGDFTVVATGQQLTQSDLDIWCAVVNLENGNKVDVSCHTLLRHLDRHDGSSDRAWLVSALQRLHKCHVVITFKDEKRRGYTGTLIKDLQLRACTGKEPTPQGRKRRSVNNQIELLIDPAIAHLFNAGCTQLPTSWRRQMRMKPLANWLTAYYLTHADPRRVKVDTLRRFSGSPSRSSAFKTQLEEALRFVRSAGYFPVATTVGDLVEVVRGPFASDARPNAGSSLPQLGPLQSAPISTPVTVIARRKAANSFTSRIRGLIRAVSAYFAW